MSDATGVPKALFYTPLQGVSDLSFYVHTEVGGIHLVLRHPEASLPLKAGIIVAVGKDLGNGSIPMLVWCKASVLLFPGHNLGRHVSVPTCYGGVTAVSASPIPKQMVDIVVGLDSHMCQCSLQWILTTGSNF